MFFALEGLRLHMYIVLECFWEGGQAAAIRLVLLGLHSLWKMQPTLMRRSHRSTAQAASGSGSEERLWCFRKCGVSVSAVSVNPEDAHPWDWIRSLSLPSLRGWVTRCGRGLEMEASSALSVGNQGKGILLRECLQVHRKLIPRSGLWMLVTTVGYPLLKFKSRHLHNHIVPRYQGTLSSGPHSFVIEQLHTLNRLWVNEGRTGDQERTWVLGK